MSQTPLQLHVKGMSCQHCVKAITLALQALDADAQVQIDLAQGLVNVVTQLPAATVQQAILDEGYEIAT